MIELSKKKKEKARRRGMVLGSTRKVEAEKVLEVLTGGRRKERKGNPPKSHKLLNAVKSHNPSHRYRI